MQHEKTCKIHGELEQENIIIEPNKSAKRGYTLRCRLCKLNKDRKWKEENREKHNASACTARNEARKLYREGIIDIEPKANIWAREDKKEHPEKYKEWVQKSKKKHWKKNSVHESLRQLGITLDVYESLLGKHQNLCAICGNEETRKSRNGGICRLAIDHCHDSGKIRGLLCHGCNTGLGKFKDNINLLESAIQYLKQHKHIKDDSTGVIQ